MQHDASYPREEPGAGNLHARIRQGKAEWLSYSTISAVVVLAAVVLGTIAANRLLRPQWLFEFSAIALLL